MIWELSNTCHILVTWYLPFFPLLWSLRYYMITFSLPDREIIIPNATCNAVGSITSFSPSNKEKHPDDRKSGLLWAALFPLKAFIFLQLRNDLLGTVSFRIHALSLMTEDRNGNFCTTPRYVSCLKTYLYCRTLCLEVPIIETGSANQFSFSELVGKPDLTSEKGNYLGFWWLVCRRHLLFEHRPFCLLQGRLSLVSRRLRSSLLRGGVLDVGHKSGLEEGFLSWLLRLQGWLRWERWGMHRQRIFILQRNLRGVSGRERSLSCGI